MRHSFAYFAIIATILTAVSSTYAMENTNEDLKKAKREYYITKANFLKTKELLLIHQFLRKDKCNSIKNYLENRKRTLIKTQHIVDPDSD